MLGRRYGQASFRPPGISGQIVVAPLRDQPADVGISLPGTNEVPVAPVYVDGEKTVTLKGERIAEEFQAIVEAYVKENFSPGARRRRPARRTATGVPIKAL